MKLLQKVSQNITSLRNSIDFEIRSQIKFKTKVTEASLADMRFQTKVSENIKRVPWSALKIIKNAAPGSMLKVADIGARNFVLAPVIFDHFQSLGFNPVVSGIEIDAFRRMSNFSTRFDQAKFFQSQAPGSEFLAIDFLKWNQDLHLAFVFNPFITLKPLLSWGLPKGMFRPRDFFLHLKKQLEKYKGAFLMTNPSSEEKEAAEELAEQTGFRCLWTGHWDHSGIGSKECERYASLFGQK